MIPQHFSGQYWSQFNHGHVVWCEESDQVLFKNSAASTLRGTVKLCWAQTQLCRLINPSLFYYLELLDCSGKKTKHNNVPRPPMTNYQTASAGGCWRKQKGPHIIICSEQSATICQFCVLWQWPIKLHSARLCAQATLIDVTCPWHSHGVSVYDSLGRNGKMHVSSLLEVICWVLSVFMLFLPPYMKQPCSWVVSLHGSSQPLLVYCLMVSPENLDTNLEAKKPPSCIDMYCGCAILEK